MSRSLFCLGIAAHREPSWPFSLDEFIRREVKLAQASKPLDAVSARFVQLHLQAERDKSEAAEYRKLYDTMRTRWRWHSATLEAKRGADRATDAAKPASRKATVQRQPAW